MSGEAVLEFLSEYLGGGVVPARLSAFAMWVVAECFDYVSCFVADGGDRAQVVAMQVAGVFDAVASAFVHGDGVATGFDVVDVCRQAAFCVFFIEAVDVGSCAACCGGAGDLFDLFAVGAIAECQRAAALLYSLGFVVTCIAYGAGCSAAVIPVLGDVAVGVVVQGFPSALVTACGSALLP